MRSITLFRQSRLVLLLRQPGICAGTFRLLSPQSREVRLTSSLRRLSSARPLPSQQPEEDDVNQERSVKLWKTINRQPLPRPLRMVRRLQQPLDGSAQQQSPIIATDSPYIAIQDETALWLNEQEQLPKPQQQPMMIEPTMAINNANLAPTELTYTGDTTMPITTRLHLVTPEEDIPSGIWPVFRLMDENGEFRQVEYDEKPTQRRETPSFSSQHSEYQASGPHDLDALRAFLADVYPVHQDEWEHCALLRHAQHPYPDVAESPYSTNTLLRAHRQMIRLRQMDDIMLNAQRQGRISFYMTCRGEEAIHMGAASAMDLNDVVFAQYREQGILMWRGFTLDQFMNQCFSNDMDLGKGRQMPVHYGSRALNFHTISSPLGTQIPQAVGAAYRLKLAGQNSVAVCFFGDGCASTTDFHSGLNFAATLQAPVVFFCRNNGYAISTPVTDQYAGDGVVSRAPGYGIAAIRVDGNDIFAVHAAMREAKRYALQNKAPVLIEAMTYRQGHHSTSDDSTRYRSKTEVEDFADRFDPLVRLGNFLKRQGVLPSTPEAEATIFDEEKLAVLKAMEKAEKRSKPSLDQLFEDVYQTLPPHLREQKEQLLAHIAKYPKKYQ